MHFVVEPNAPSPELQTPAQTPAVAEMASTRGLPSYFCTMFEVAAACSEDMLPHCRAQPQHGCYAMFGFVFDKLCDTSPRCSPSVHIEDKEER